MKPMKDKSFIDTNIPLYCYSSTEPEKQRRAIEISGGNQVHSSAHVLKEFANILFKKFRVNWNLIEKAVEEFTGNYLVAINTPETISKACQLCGKYHFAFYDSLITASAPEAGCNILFTEDLQHKQIIENKLQIVNPFLI